MRFLAIVLAIATAGMLTSTSVVGQKFSDSFIKGRIDAAVHAIAIGVVEQGIASLTHLAESGYTEAQFELGLVYHPDNNPEPDLEKSAYWLGKAADNGHVNASFLVGAMTLWGQGRPADAEAAFAYFSFAAENNHPDALAFAGTLLANGAGVAQDIPTARQWLDTAIENGSSLAPQFLAELEGAFATASTLPIPTPTRFDDPATFPPLDEEMLAQAQAGDPEMQFELGGYHAHPNNPNRDLTQAWLWYRSAAEAGVAPAQYELGLAYMHGLGVEADLERAHHWLTEAYANEYNEASEALFELEQQANVPANTGFDFQSGQDAFDAGDIDGALAIWEFLAERDDRDSQVRLGEIYQYGRGVEADYAIALDWFNRATEANDPRAQYYLGRMYETGRGVGKNLETARHWYTLAADQGLPTAQLNLGVMFQYGEGGPLDLREARRLYELAAEHDHPLALFNAGIMHYYAQGTLENTDRARQYWTRAAELGNADAAALLEELF